MYEIMGGSNTLMRDFITIITETSSTICLYFQEATYLLPEEEEVVSEKCGVLFVNISGVSPLVIWR